MLRSHVDRILRGLLRGVPLSGVESKTFQKGSLSIPLGNAQMHGSNIASTSMGYLNNWKSPPLSGLWLDVLPVLSSQCNSHTTIIAINTTNHVVNGSGSSGNLLMHTQGGRSSLLGLFAHSHHAMQQQQWRGAAQLSRVKVPKSAGINDIIVPNTVQLKYGSYGIRAVTSKRVAANTIEAARRVLRRKIKKDAKLWIRIQATVPVTRKPEGIRMGKGKGAISFYATPIRPGQILFEMDRVQRSVAIQAMEAIKAKFPVKLGFVEWS